MVESKFSVQLRPKLNNCQYLGLEAKNDNSKTTLFSQTFEVPENKVPLFFSFFASRPRY